MKKSLLPVCLFICAVSLSWAAETGSENFRKEPFRFKNRMIEVGAGVKFGFANDFLTAYDVFQETMVVDLDNQKDGLQFDLGMNLSPFFFNFNKNDDFGFGVFINAEAAGNMSLSGNMLTFKEAEDDQSGAGAAVFAEAGGNTFFHVRKFRIKANSAVFYPLIYTRPEISYTYRSGKNKEGDNTLELLVTYDMDVYSAFSMENMEGLTGRPGFDFGGGVEYPLFPFLDLGADLTHIPLVPAELTDYMRLKGTAGIEETPDIIGDKDDIFSTEGDDATYGKGSKSILRPFKLIAWTDYRPLNTRLLSLIPSLGFAINPLYIQPASMEGGLKIRCDLANILIATVGVNYEDRLWKNSLDLGLNLRAIELDFGVAVQSQSFAKSWTGGGLALSAGIKTGW